MFRVKEKLGSEVEIRTPQHLPKVAGNYKISVIMINILLKV